MQRQMRPILKRHWKGCWGQHVKCLTGSANNNISLSKLFGIVDYSGNSDNNNIFLKKVMPAKRHGFVNKSLPGFSNSSVSHPYCHSNYISFGQSNYRKFSTTKTVNGDNNNRNSDKDAVSVNAPSKFRTSSSYLPHPDKVETNGEDAHMISSCNRVIGVADGVGGWRDLGVDAGDFSRELMQHAENYVNETGIPEPKFVLQSAYENVQAIGTSTICVVSILKEKLRACNLGDSGFCVFRRGGEENPDCLKEYKLVFKTEEQTHFFNCPYQVGTNSNDGPENAEYVEYGINVGDLVLVATDGVFDNVFEYELEEIINENIDVYVDTKGSALDDALGKCSKILATTAHRYGVDRKRHGPFSKNASLFGYDYSGGKTDDVTVVLGYVV